MNLKRMRTKRWRRLLLGMGAAAALSGVGAQAQSSDTILDLLLRKGIITDREAKELKEQADADAARAMDRAIKHKAPSWIEKINWAGDLRLRAEHFSFEESRNVADRTRYRYRLRYGGVWNATDWATIGLRLASGEGDPVSTNTTFTDTFKKKPITIDLAYVTLTPPMMQTEDWSVKLTGGKMSNPIWQPNLNSPLVYDGDVTPEGLGEQVAWKFGDGNRHTLFANLGQFALKEFGSDSNDIYLLDSQIGAELRFGADSKKPVLKTTVAGGFFNTSNLRNMALTTGGTGATSSNVADSPNRGNATRFTVPAGSTASVFFADDYQVAYGRGELVWQPTQNKFLGAPVMLTLSGEYVSNINSAFNSVTLPTGGTPSVPVLETFDGDTDGWTVQLAFGEAKKRGEWQVAYQYKHLGADAVWDAITDSDWGEGGTDRMGHVVKAGYNVRDWWQLSIGVFVTEKISDRPNSLPAAWGSNANHNTRGMNGEEQLRFQIDSSFRF